jgi:teichuronic acid biosynthesis glycosyltransferase TuaC
VTNGTQPAPAGETQAEHRPIRVLILASSFPSPRDPDQGPFMLRQLDVVRERGCEFRVVAPLPKAPWPAGLLPGYHRMAERDRQAPPIEEYEGYRISHPKYWKLPGRLDFGLFGPFYYRGVLRAVRAIYGEWKFDLIRGLSLVPDGYAAARLGRELGVPTMAAERGFINRCPDTGSWRRMYAETIASLDCVTAVSQAVAAKVHQLGTPRQPVKVIYTGVDRELFAPAPVEESRRSLGLPSGRLIACFARFEAIKQPLLLLEAFGQLAGRYQDLHLLWVGEGSMKGPFTETARRLGLAERVVLPGMVAHHAMPAWMRAADVVLLASESEGLPNTLVEAAACGKPVVATCVGGIPEVVLDGQTGLLVPQGDASALTAAVGRLLDDPVLARQMGERGREFVLGRFSWKRYGQEMLTLYQSLLGKG